MGFHITISSAYGRNRGKAHSIASPIRFTRLDLIRCFRYLYKDSESAANHNTSIPSQNEKVSPVWQYQRPQLISTNESSVQTWTIHHAHAMSLATLNHSIRPTHNTDHLMWVGVDLLPIKPQTRALPNPCEPPLRLHHRSQILHLLPPLHLLVLNDVLLDETPMQEDQLCSIH